MTGVHSGLSPCSEDRFSRAGRGPSIEPNACGMLCDLWEIYSGPARLARHLRLHVRGDCEEVKTSFDQMFGAHLLHISASILIDLLSTRST